MNPLQWLGIDFKTFANERNVPYALLALALGAMSYQYVTKQGEIESATNYARKIERESCVVQVEGYKNELAYLRGENKDLKKIILDQQKILFETHLTQKLP